MRKSLDAGHAVRLDSVKTIADGLAAPMAGDLTYDVVRRYADDVVVIEDAQIEDAMRTLLFDAKMLAEGAGAAATAAIISGAIPLRGNEHVAAVVSGGNVDEKTVMRVLKEWS